MRKMPVQVSFVLLIILFGSAMSIWSDEPKVFQEPGIFSVESPEVGYTWRKVKDETIGGQKGAIYACTKEGSTKAAVLNIEYRKADDENVRRAALKGHYNGLYNSSQKANFRIIETQRPLLKSPIADSVPFSIKMEAPNGTKLFIYCKTVFGNNTYLIQVTAPSDDEAKTLFQAVSKSFREDSLAQQGSVKMDSKNKSISDGDRIQGHWILVEKQGENTSTSVPGLKHFVFTDKELKMTGNEKGMTFQYKLNSEKEPKEFDLSEPLLDMVIPGIYQLEGDKLRLCWGSTLYNERPKSFKAGFDQQAMILEKVKPSSKGSLSFEKPGFKPSDNKITNEIQKRIEDAAEMLKTKKYEKFINEILEPGDLRLAEAKKPITEFLKKKGPPMVELFNAMKAKVPLVNETKTEAIFDMRDIHANGGSANPEFKLKKVDGKWYFCND